MKPPYAYILFADDDNDDQQLLCERFATHNPDVRFECVSDGAEAVHYLRRCLPDHVPAIILLDYKMPKLSAPEVLKAIREDSRYANVPKIVWSTSRNPLHIQECLQSGAQRYLFKPFDMHGFDEIVECLSALCSQDRAA